MTAFDSRAFYDQKASSYDAEMNCAANREVRRRVEQLIRRFSPGAGAALDFGCGTGSDVEALLGQGRRVLAYDPSSQMLAQLRSRYSEAVRRRRVVAISGEMDALYAGIADFEPIRVVSANFGVVNHLPQLAIFSELVVRRLPSLQAVILGVHNALYLPDVSRSWWWRGLWAGRGDGAILCEGGAVQTRRYFLRTLEAALSPVFRLRASCGIWAPMRVLAFERVA